MLRFAAFLCLVAAAYSSSDILDTFPATRPLNQVSNIDVDSSEPVEEDNYAGSDLSLLQTYVDSTVEGSDMESRAAAEVASSDGVDGALAGKDPRRRRRDRRRRDRRRRRRRRRRRFRRRTPFPTPAPTPSPTPNPTPNPTPSPTLNPCDDGSSNCDTGAGGICTRTVQLYTDSGLGTCRFNGAWPTNERHRGMERSDCKSMCTQKSSCYGYTTYTEDTDYCLLWTQGPLTGGGDSGGMEMHCMTKSSGGGDAYFPYVCSCASGYECTSGCTAPYAGHTCTMPTPSPTPTPTPNPTPNPTPLPSPSPTSTPTPQPTADPTDSPTPALTASTTTTTTAGGQCQNECANYTESWYKKCKWSMRCSACPQCATAQSCTKTCSASTKPWKSKCKKLKNCAGCGQCAQLFDDTESDVEVDDDEDLADDADVEDDEEEDLDLD